MRPTLACRYASGLPLATTFLGRGKRSRISGRLRVEDERPHRNARFFIQSALLPWLVAEHDGTVVGYAYATKWRVRKAYRFSTEVTVYLDPGMSGRGIGSMLTMLCSRLFESEIYTRRWEGSLFPTIQVWPSTKNWDSKRWRTLSK